MYETSDGISAKHGQLDESYIKLHMTLVSVYICGSSVLTLCTANYKYYAAYKQRKECYNHCLFCIGIKLLTAMFNNFFMNSKYE